jgi:hypothetical protein
MLHSPYSQHVLRTFSQTFYYLFPNTFCTILITCAQNVVELSGDRTTEMLAPDTHHFCLPIISSFSYSCDCSMQQPSFYKYISISHRNNDRRIYTNTLALMYASLVEGGEINTHRYNEMNPGGDVCILTAAASIHV